MPGRCQAPTLTSSTTSKRNYKSFLPEPIHGLGPSLSVLSTSQLKSPQHLQAESERSVQQWCSFIPSLAHPIRIPRLSTTYMIVHLVSQARPSSTKEGKGLVNCVYQPCPAALYSAVQSHCSILSHDALRHCLSSNTSQRELGHLFRYCRSCKNTSTILLGKSS